ncbi:SDR family oxidoreductase [Chloroflexota bacterium]
MRCLVTGGAGFIGSHLVSKLLSKGHQVIVIDNFSTGRRDNLAHYDKSPTLSIIEADIADFNSIHTYFQEVNWVFHVAGLADIVPSIQQPMNYHHANVNGTISALEAARSAGVQRFIYTASSSCYGIPDISPTPETAAIKCEYPYAFTKYTGEQYALHWGKVYKLPIISLRLFNVYGPRSRTSGAYGAVFGVFLAQKINNSPFTVVGDGNQSRDFVFVTDVANAYIMAAESRTNYEVLNVGSGNTYSVNSLTKLLGGDVIHVPNRPGEPDCTQADTSKIRHLLGWKPEVSFEKGVGIMLEHINHWRNAPVWTPEKIHAATEDWFKYLSR